MNDRAVLHLDIDAFFASVEQVLFPQLCDRPVIVGNGVIASVSYEGRRFGLHAGMPLWQAKRLCPQAVILDGSYQVYRCFAERVFQLCAERTPTMETFLDEAYLDMSGTQRLLGAAPSVAEGLRAEVRGETGLGVSCGVAPNRMLAKMVARGAKPDGLGVLEAGEVEEFLVERPVAELPGIGAKIARDMQQYGIATIGELRDFSRGVMRTRYGKHGVVIHERAHGRDTVAVTPREVPRTVSRETSFHQPTSDPLEIEGMLQYLVERGMKHVRGLGLRTGRIDVSVRYEDGRGSSGRDRSGHRFRPPTTTDEHAFSAALDALRRVHTRRVSLRHIGVVLSSFTAAEPLGQLLLGEAFDPAGEQRARKLNVALDQIRDRFGHSAIVAGKSIHLLDKLDQDRDGFVLRTPSLTK